MGVVFLNAPHSVNIFIFQNFSYFCVQENIHFRVYLEATITSSDTDDTEISYQEVVESSGRRLEGPLELNRLYIAKTNFIDYNNQF